MSALPDPHLSAERAARRLDSRVLRVTESVGEFIEWWGFKSIHGRIWTVLALHHEPMSQVEIARTLGVSRALVSSSIRELVGFRLVSATHDGRNAPWEAVIDVWPTISDVLRSREWMMVESARVALEGAIEEAEIAADLGEEVAWDIDRMRALLRLTEAAQSLLKILVALRAPRAAEGMTDWVKRASLIFRGLRRSER
ncbi:MAG: hypothetical protein KC502_14990 [Myxococcales bacterium]|nr:hypothetical protein [Myxococcales bacterium]